MRCFIAIDLPKEVKKELSVINEYLKNLKNSSLKAKFVDPNILHLTLAFLGEISANKVNIVKSILRELSNSFKKTDAEIGEVGFFPNENFIKVLWIKLNPEEIFVKWHDTIVKKLREKGIKANEKFESHITIARIKYIKNKEEFFKKLKEIKIKPMKFVVDSVKLKKSTLTREGSIYEDICVCNLS